MLIYYKAMFQPSGVLQLFKRLATVRQCHIRKVIGAFPNRQSTQTLVTESRQSIEYADMDRFSYALSVEFDNRQKEADNSAPILARWLQQPCQMAATTT